MRIGPMQKAQSVKQKLLHGFVCLENLQGATGSEIGWRKDVKLASR